MTKSEYLNLLIETTNNGGFPASNTTQCFYRHKTGKRCVVGIILPDELYSPRMDEFGGKTVGAISKQIGTAWYPEGVKLEDLEKLQYIHDDLARRNWNNEEFINRIKEIL